MCDHRGAYENVSDCCKRMQKENMISEYGKIVSEYSKRIRQENTVPQESTAIRAVCGNVQKRERR